jgi:hypothetical protein
MFRPPSGCTFRPNPNTKSGSTCRVFDYPPVAVPTPPSLRFTVTSYREFNASKLGRSRAKACAVARARACASASTYLPQVSLRRVRYRRRGLALEPGPLSPMAPSRRNCRHSHNSTSLHSLHVNGKTLYFSLIEVCFLLLFKVLGRSMLRSCILFTSLDQPWKCFFED